MKTIMYLLILPMSLVLVATISACSRKETKVQITACGVVIEKSIQGPHINGLSVYIIIWKEKSGKAHEYKTLNIQEYVDSPIGSYFCTQTNL